MKELHKLYTVIIENQDECSICLEQLENEVCILSCKHSFHYDCLSKWIINCKKKITNNMPFL